MSKFSILVIGDSCDDEYIFGTVHRISPEVPVPVLKYEFVEKSKGMAANVERNVAAFDVATNIITQKEQIVKSRFIDRGSGQQLMRMDEEKVSSPCTAAQVRIAFIHANYDALIISDYNKGFLDRHALGDLCETFQGPIFIDTKKTQLFQKENVFWKINKKEFDLLDRDYLPELTHLVVTLGADGVKWRDIHYPSEKVEVHDVCGAGDTFLAAMAYEYLNTKGDMEKAIDLANRAAAIAVQHSGTYTLTEDDIEVLYRHRRDNMLPNLGKGLPVGNPLAG